MPKKTLDNLLEPVTLAITELSNKLSLTVHFAPDGIDSVTFTTSNISRPGLFLAGFHNYFAFDRIQLIGEQESAYLKTLTAHDKEAALNSLLKREIPCVILSSGLKPSKELLAAAKKYSRIVLGSDARSTSLLSQLSLFLTEALAPVTRQHGVLADIYGVGVLVIGKSGVGKSETVLELLKNGHRLVADDSVYIKRIGNRLVGSSPESIRHLMEVRGIGLINVSLMYGAGAVLDEQQIDLIIALEEFDKVKDYNRLGDMEETFNILELPVPMNTIPVKTGRNVAVILEVAARNYRLKESGHDALALVKSRLGIG